MSDISTLGSALYSVVPSLWDSIPARPSMEEIWRKLNSVPCTICSAMSVPEASLNTNIITVTTAENSVPQPDPDRKQVAPLSSHGLLRLLEEIPKTIPKGMKWGDLGWYLIFAEACVFAAGYAYSTRTGRSLIVTWTGKLPRSQVTSSPASPDETIDRDTWASLMQAFAKLKPAEAGSQTPHMEMRVDERSVTVSCLTAAGWVCRTSHVEATTVYPPGSIGPDMHIPLEKHQSPSAPHIEAVSDAEPSDDDPVYTPPGSVAGEDDLAQTTDV